MTTSKATQPTLFDRASRVFDGWNDPQTGLPVLKVATTERDMHPSVQPGGTWSTLYHQSRCFLEGGRKVLLHGSPLRGSSPDHRKRGRMGQFVMDLATGELTAPFPKGCRAVDLGDATNTAALTVRDGDPGVVLWDLASERALASHSLSGWALTAGKLLGDGKRMVAGFHTGPWRRGRCHSQHFLLQPDGQVKQILDAEGYFCNHVVGCPTDPDLYAYDRWPTPDQAVAVVIHIRNVDGSFETPLPLLEDTVRPGPAMECNRDHYVWTPDGTRIASYLLPDTEDFAANHYSYRWWISVTNWRTGEDLCVPYPQERWGGHFQVTPDSRYPVSGGGQNLDYLYAIDIEGLRNGWNERLLCQYPPSPPEQYGASVNHHPHVLPDMSAVLFTAGWGGPGQGVYMVEWPRDMIAG